MKDKKSNIKKDKWINERILEKYTVNKKKLGVELFYTNGKLQTVTYGTVENNILWANTLPLGILTGLLKKIKSKAVIQAIAAEEVKKIEDNIKYISSEVTRQEKQLKEYKKTIAEYKKRADMLETFAIKELNPKEVNHENNRKQS